MTDTTDETTDDCDEDSGWLTDKTGVVWVGLPTLVAGCSIAVFLAIVVGTALEGAPIDARAVPPEWYGPFIMLVGGSAVTTIGADAMEKWGSLR